MMAFIDTEDGVYFTNKSSMPRVDDLMNPVVMWTVLVIFYLSLVAICGSVNEWPRLCWWQVCSIGGKSSSRWCRHSRLFRCQKRQRRRKQQGCCMSHAWECPLSKLRRMPPPLPFHRRRTRCKTTESEQTVSAVAQESQQIQVISSEGPAEATATQRTSTMLVATPKALEVSKSTTQPQPDTTLIIQRSPAVQTSVIDLARMQQWSRLIERVATNRREAKHRDIDGLMPLHWACSGGPPLEAVEALLQAYPRASRRVDSDGSTALHFACHYGGSADVVRALLEANPKAAVRKDKYGRTPLYHAVSKSANVDVIRILVDTEPLMVLEPCLPPSSDGTITVQDRRPVQHRTPLFMAWAQVSPTPHTRRRRRTGKALEKANLLLEAAYRLEGTRPKKLLQYRMLHAAVKLDSFLPPHVLQLAIEHHPEQLRQPEELLKRLPLAIATELRSPRAQQVIRLLCEAYPQAAREIDSHGRTPLAIALASGKQWNEGIKQIFEAAPEAVKWRDRQSRLYPVLLAASTTKVAVDNYQEEVADEAKQTPKLTLSPPTNITSNDKALHWHAQVSYNVKNDREEASPESDEWDNTDAESQHLSSLYELLQAAPSTVKCN